MNKIITPLSHCEWNKTLNELFLSSECFAGSIPNEVHIESHHTGKVLTFKPIGPGDSKFSQDGWDGEQMIYRSTEKARVEYLTVYHQH